MSAASLSSGRFCRLLGVNPVIGRNFRPEEDQPGAPRSAIISHALWQDRYGGDPHIAGREFHLDGARLKIAGVLPADFEFPTLARVDVLVPQQLDEPLERERKSVSLVRAFGRLKPGVPISQAATALDPFFAHFLTTISPGFRKEVRLEVTPLDDLLRRNGRATAWLLLGAVISVLLIAWTNVANLWLARAASREHETGIRVALGAGRARQMLQSGAEFLLLAGAGWAGGLVLASTLLAIFRHAAPANIPGLRHATLDGRILLFSGAVLVLCTLAFSLLAVLRVARQRHGSRIAGPRSLRFRGALVTVQLAISVVLSASTGLLVHSLWELGRVDMGVDPRGVTTASMFLGPHRFRTAPERYAFVERLESGLRRLPGVKSVAIADQLPPLGAGSPFMYGSIAVDGVRVGSKEPGGGVIAHRINPGYFQALGIRLLRGRSFSAADMNAPVGVTVLSERLARRLFPGRDPAGHTIQPAGWRKAYTVIGVASNVKNAGLTAEDSLEMYLPFDAQETSRFVSAAVSGTAGSDRMAGLMSAEIRALDRTLPFKIESFEARIAGLNERPRFNTAVLASFAGIGVLLAAIGVYGVLSFLVSQRVREIGVRMALGATRGSILVWVLLYSMRWAAAGLLLGLAGVFAIARPLRSMLYGVTPADPWTMAAIVILLAVVAAISGGVPARRAAALDPAVTLRGE